MSVENTPGPGTGATTKTCWAPADAARADARTNDANDVRRMGTSGIDVPQDRASRCAPPWVDSPLAGGARTSWSRVRRARRCAQEAPGYARRRSTGMTQIHGSLRHSMCAWMAFAAAAVAAPQAPAQAA